MKRIIIAALMVCSSSLLHTMVTQSTVVQYDTALKNWKRTGSQADAQAALDLYNRIAGTRWAPTAQNINRREGITVTDLQTAATRRMAPVAPPPAPIIPAAPVAPVVAPVAPIIPTAPIIPAAPGAPAGGYIPARPIVAGPGEGDLAGELARREERRREREEADRLAAQERERLERELKAAIAREKAEKDKLEQRALRLEVERLDREFKAKMQAIEAERLQREKAENDREEAERLEAERQEKMQREIEEARLAQEKEERDKKYITSDSGFVFDVHEGPEEIIHGTNVPQAPEMEYSEDLKAALYAIEDNIRIGNNIISKGNVEKARRYYNDAREEFQQPTINDALSSQDRSRIAKALDDLASKIDALSQTITDIASKYPEIQSDLIDLERTLSAVKVAVEMKHWISNDAKRGADVANLINVLSKFNNLQGVILSPLDRQAIQQKINTIVQDALEKLFEQIKPLSNIATEKLAKNDRKKNNFNLLYFDIKALVDAGVNLSEEQQKNFAVLTDKFTRLIDAGSSPVSIPARPTAEIPEGIPSAPPLTPEEAKKYAPRRGGEAMEPYDLTRQGYNLQDVGAISGSAEKSVNEAIEEIKNQLITGRWTQATETQAHARIKQLIDQAKIDANNIASSAIVNQLSDVLNRLETALKVRVNRNTKLTQEELNQILEHGAPTAPDTSANVNIPASVNFESLKQQVRDALSKPPHEVSDELKNTIQAAIDDMSNALTGEQRQTLKGYIAE